MSFHRIHDPWSDLCGNRQCLQQFPFELFLSMPLDAKHLINLESTNVLRQPACTREFGGVAKEAEPCPGPAKRVMPSVSRPTGRGAAAGGNKYAVAQEGEEEEARGCCSEQVYAQVAVVVALLGEALEAVWAAEGRLLGVRAQVHLQLRVEAEALAAQVARKGARLLAPALVGPWAWATREDRGWAAHQVARCWGGLRGVPPHGPVVQARCCKGRHPPLLHTPCHAPISEQCSTLVGAEASLLPVRKRSRYHPSSPSCPSALAEHHGVQQPGCLPSSLDRPSSTG